MRIANTYWFSLTLEKCSRSDSIMINQDMVFVVCVCVCIEIGCEIMYQLYRAAFQAFLPSDDNGNKSFP